MSENLTSFGPTFQMKVIASLLEDPVFTQTVLDILKPIYFESDANRWLVDTIVSYFMEYKTNATLEVLKVKIDEIENDILKAGVVENLKEAWRNIESPDLEFIKEETLNFCKNQVLKNAIVQSVDLLEIKDYDGIKKLIDDAMRSGAERNLGHDYIIGIEERLTKNARETIKSPWDVVNEIMDGGLGTGELGVIVAPAGIGKTWCLQSIAAGAVRDGLSVIHYTLELNQAYVGLRYDTVFSGVTTTNIKFHKEKVEKIISELEGKLLIKYYPTKSASVQTLSSHLKQSEIQGIKPDLVIVDYADILVGVGSERRFVLENVYEELRGLAGEFDVPIWTASQANRSALEEHIIDATKVAEAYAKVMIADFVMSMSRKVEDKISNTGRFHVIKNRFGPDGITFPSTVNTNIGNIQVYEETTKGGKIAQGKMDNSKEYERKMLSKKYDDMNKVDGFE